MSLKACAYDFHPSLYRIHGLFTWHLNLLYSLGYILIWYSLWGDDLSQSSRLECLVCVFCQGRVGGSGYRITRLDWRWIDRRHLGHLFSGYCRGIGVCRSDVGEL